jgi:hypothetical protein
MIDIFHLLLGLPSTAILVLEQEVISTFWPKLCPVYIKNSKELRNLARDAGVGGRSNSNRNQYAECSDKYE